MWFVGYTGFLVGMYTIFNLYLHVFIAALSVLIEYSRRPARLAVIL
jgi:hypothetical protein